MRKVGVSRLVYALFSERIKNVIVDYETIKTGFYYHRKFGFDQREVKCEMLYRYRGRVFLLRGKPDDVSFEKGRVVISELKTYKNKGLRETMGLMGLVQANVYAYMLTRDEDVLIRSYVYHPSLKEPELYHETKANFELADWTIRRGLDLIIEDERTKEEILKVINKIKR